MGQFNNQINNIGVMGITQKIVIDKDPQISSNEITGLNRLAISDRIIIKY